MTLTDMVMSLLKEPMSVRMVVNACKERYGEEVLQASVSNVVRRKHSTDELVVVGNTCATGRQAMIYQINPDYKPKIEHIAKPKKCDKQKALECLKQGDATAKSVALRIGANQHTIAKYLRQYWEQGVVFRTRVKAMGTFIYSLDDKTDNEFFLVDDGDDEEESIRKSAHFIPEGKNNWLGVWF